jgi:hypothetical protein
MASFPSLYTRGKELCPTKSGGEIMQQASNNEQYTPKDLPGDEIEHYAGEVHDGGLEVKDASENVVEALNDGKPVNPKDLEALRQAMTETEMGLSSLEEALREKGLWPT